ncbi:hypothetical protein ATK74_0524 [Propionicimonas paludicola]|uniref:Uncharacterized protein n=1 Tax=Propionicimonas paludicola TaxID=185243 RepID=A0A2A9CQS4_9ACTN|nr:hypothetical protein ATK74_0524 [Propionicimonas paludicola]
MELKINRGWTGNPATAVADLIGVTAGSAKQR